MNAEHLGLALQSGILLAIVTGIFKLGRIIERWDAKLEDHERRISDIEDRIY